MAVCVLPRLCPPVEIALGIGRLGLRCSTEVEDKSQINAVSLGRVCGR